MKLLICKSYKTVIRQHAIKVPDDIPQNFLDRFSKEQVEKFLNDPNGTYEVLYFLLYHCLDLESDTFLDVSCEDNHEEEFDVDVIECKEI